MGQRMADLLTQLTAQNQAIVQSMQLQQQQLQQQFNAADIYGDDVGFIDDGYDRSKLNVPGLLHLEVGSDVAASTPAPPQPARQATASPGMGKMTAERPPQRLSCPAASRGRPSG